MYQKIKGILISQFMTALNMTKGRVLIRCGTKETKSLILPHVYKCNVAYTTLTQMFGRF